MPGHVLGVQLLLGSAFLRLLPYSLPLQVHVGTRGGSQGAGDMVGPHRAPPPPAGGSPAQSPSLAGSQEEPRLKSGLVHSPPDITPLLASLGSSPWISLTSNMVFTFPGVLGPCNLRSPPKVVTLSRDL